MPSDVAFSQCFHCGKNQRHRGGANYYTCRHCGKRNPGIRVIRDLLGTELKLGGDETPAKGKTSNGAAATLIVSGAPKQPAPVTPAPAAVKKAAVKAPPPAKPIDAPRRSLLSRALHG